MNIGERLASYRAKSEHTHESLSLASGVSSRWIAKIEKNKGSPSINTMEKLLGACRITLGEFFREPHLELYDPLAQDMLNKLDLMLHDPDQRDFVIRVIVQLFRGSESESNRK
jgi:transcriptional regulator with XRE-family HTH domain